MHPIELKQSVLAIMIVSLGAYLLANVGPSIDFSCVYITERTYIGHNFHWHVSFNFVGWQ